MKKILTLMLSSIFALNVMAQESHFISDQAYRDKVEKAFTEKIQLVGQQFFNTDGLNLNSEEIQALHFLYAYMALADITDYPTAFHAANVRSAFQARREMAWGSKVPELLFRHFVLPERVNNEPLDDSRQVFYKDLKRRVEGLSMKDAILEVNHWCHEHVTYQPSDGRTLSPLACVKTAIGRCGEESTFTVTALRSVGIPARQVYTPRWAHTDDNHAWVEAWADGEWYFLGACEPEAVLNLGWFNAPASRAMLMHTRAFGDYNGPEEVMLRTSNFTEINLIDNYGTTGRTDFRIVDRKGKAVDGARVDFKIYNYAEFYTAVTKYTDERGRTFLTAGLGDMLVWASKDGWYGYAKASFGKDKLVTIKLENNIQKPTKKAREVVDINIVPPPEKVTMPEVSPAMAAHNKARFAAEDSIRKAYEATFLSKDEAEHIYPAAADLLAMSRGNWRTLLDFLYRHADQEERALKLLRSLSNKDLRDMPTEILEDNFSAESDQLCPRVETEMIILPFKQFFQNEMKNGRWTLADGSMVTKEKFQQDPSLLVRWVKEQIRIYPDQKALRIAQTPVGVWRSRITDPRSRDIFFVDLARSLGIEAQKDVVTGKVQYKRSGSDSWIDVDFDATEQLTAKTGTLVLDYEPTKFLDDPKYYSHFSIARILDNGTTQLLNFEEGQVDMGGGTSWNNTFRQGTPLDAGTYMLTTGTRLANGSVLATNQEFVVNEGQTTRLPLKMRQNTNEVSVIGSFDSESKFNLITDIKQPTASQQVSVLSQTGRGYFVVGILGVGQEPTNHAMRDIARAHTDLDKWGRPLVLLFESEADARKYAQEDFGQLPKNVVYGIDTDGSIRRQIATQMKMQGNGQLPLFIIADTFNRVVFSSEGYTIGLGEQMQKIISKL